MLLGIENHERVSCFVPSLKYQIADSEKEASGDAPGAARGGERFRTGNAKYTKVLTWVNISQSDNPG